ncbi:ankyrin repeat-containing domain protein [Hypomontagnella submonticulosa]|nr:ankyrin repeat-containing domain protein [Hypomontagnella submonticulosa]
MAYVPGEIMIEASRTRRHLRELCAEISTKIDSGSLPDGVYADSNGLTDCIDRFNIWAGSLGVFQKGDASLDARLSNHLLLREVVRLLTQLDTFSSDLRRIVNGSDEQRVWTQSSLQIDPSEFSDFEDSSSDSEDERVLTPDSDGLGEILSESKELYHSIEESITSLLRLSVLISKSSRKSKFARSSVDENYAVGPDVSHVRDFFPYAAENIPLVERLGKSNAQRRQWLWYRRRHREKLSVDLSGLTEQQLSLMKPVNDDGEASMVVFSIGEQQDVAMPSVTGTKASTFRSQLEPSAYSKSEILGTVFGRSSMAAPDEPHLMVPEPPHDLVLGQPYYCRYCCNMVEISGRNAWQKHVHADLSSYTCTFPNCDEIFFESRHKWWAHEMECHRKQWECGMCNARPPNRTKMVEHLKEVHGDQIPKGYEETVTNRFGRPMPHIAAADCPLCDYSGILRRRGYAEEETQHLSPEKFGRHLGRHLEQLALFVLPTSDLVGEDDISDADAEESGGNDSDDGASEVGIEVLPEPDLVQKLAEIASAQDSPENFSKPPDLAMRWQPPQDFTPPSSDFHIDDVDLLPARQEPIFGGDLHTPGWARGLGSRKEGFCARCPVFHWVNIPDGSYAFHLTYFHGVPASGVPLPRPSTIRPLQRKTDEWEGFCEACQDWKLLKKTKRGWNWYRHWLNDHADIVKTRTDAVRNGGDLESMQLPETGEMQVITDNHQSIAEQSPSDFELPTQGGSLGPHLFALARNNQPEAIDSFLMQFRNSRTSEELHELLTWVDDSGQNLLMVIASQGLDRVVGLVLSLGAKINATDSQGWTALDLATDAGYFRTAQLLIQGGADASKSHIFKTILSKESEYAGERTEAIPSVSRTADINTTSLGPLGQSALDGDVSSIVKLLGSDDGPSQWDIEEGAEFGRSAFLLACLMNHFEVTDLLLSRGANINATSKQGWTSLMLASKRDDKNCVAYLISKGADVNHLSPDRWTALTEATSKGSIGVMRMLLHAGADPEVRAQSDWTPLMHAAYRGDLEAVQLLLSTGASFEEVSARDETPMLLAAASGSAAVVRCLLDAGCAPDSMWSTAQTESISIIDENAGSETESTSALPTTTQERIERVFKVGWTPLMVASQIGSLEIVMMLLDAGANPRSKSPMFKTAIDIARENGRVDVAEYLTSRLQYPL